MTHTVTRAERLAAGEQWLDANRPEWWNRIDPDALNEANCCDDMLGQLYGCYTLAPSDVIEMAVSLGFVADPELVGKAYEWETAALTDAWRKAIHARKPKRPARRAQRVKPTTVASVVLIAFAVAVGLRSLAYSAHVLALYSGAAMTVAKPTDLFPRREKRERPARYHVDRGYGSLQPVAVCQEPQCLFEVLCGPRGGDVQPWDVEMAAAEHARDTGHEVHVIRESHTVLRRREVR